MKPTRAATNGARAWAKRPPLRFPTADRQTARGMNQAIGPKISFANRTPTALVESISSTSSTKTKTYFVFSIGLG